MPERRFPPPWTAEETDACFILRDASGQAPLTSFTEDELGWRAAAKLLTRDGARRMARPPSFPNCCVGPADFHDVTSPLRPQVRKYRRNALSDVMGQKLP